MDALCFEEGKDRHSLYSLTLSLVDFLFYILLKTIGNISLITKGIYVHGRTLENIDKQYEENKIKDNLSTQK